MELSALIDQFDDLVSHGKKVHLSDDVRVDPEEAHALLEQIRAAAPQLRDAQWIVEHREEMLDEARRETVRMLEEAREEAARLLGRGEIAKGAEQRANQLLKRAESQERQILRGAEDHAGTILERLESYLLKFGGAVSRGHHRLLERSGERGPEPGRARFGHRESSLVA